MLNNENLKILMQADFINMNLHSTPDSLLTRKVNNRSLYLDALGFNFQQTKGNKAINWATVKTCQKWIRRFGRPLLTITKISSYGLKHAVENWVCAEGRGIWVGNGEFIVAAGLEGYQLKPIFNFARADDDQPINALFNMGLPLKKEEQAAAGLLGMIEVTQMREQG